MGRGRSGRWRVCAGAALLVSPAVTSAQDAPPANHDDIVITGKRLPGSVIGDVAPVALLDADAIRALGVTKIDDMLRLLKPLTTSNSGADPVFLLNGRRISGYQELQTLPPEAIERTEILPETEAARFGFPATVRVVNFITKKHFRSLAVQETAGTTTDGGADSAALEVGLTRLDGSRRTSLTVNYDRQDGLNGAQRRTIPDPGGAFDSVGNIRGVGGGSIDPALDALAGRPVTVAAVPIDPAARGTLSSYLSGANAPRITNLAPYQSIPSRDVLKIDGTQAVPIDASTTGSLNLTLERQRGSGLAGLPTAVLRVPGETARSPFANDVLLYRYVAEAGALRLWNDSLTLHAGSTVQGSIKRWQWSVTAGYDRSRAASTVEQGIPLTDVQAAITAGADAFAPLSGDQAARRLLARSRTTTGTTAAKATANGPVLRLPAGDAQMTLAADYARSASSGTLVGGDTPTLDLSRTTRSGSVSVDLPIASADKGVLAAIGTLSANGTIGASAVSGYRSLVNSNVALSWTPVAPVQVTASINTTQTPPAIALLTNPVITLPNAPLFDFVTGSSALVTVIAGGNADLIPERRRISTAGVSWKPIKSRELRFNLDYIETLISDQTANPGSVTAALQAAFPDRFQRDAGGRLLNADLRPLNLSRERERKVQARMSLFAQLGPEPKPPTTPPAKDAPPPPPPKPRPMVYSFVTAIARIDDRLTLSPGQPTLDLLDGATLDGTGGRPRYEISGGFGASYRAIRSGFYAQWQGGTRIRSDIAASDLRFSARASAYFYTTVDAALLAPKVRWTKGMTFQFEVLNLLNTRMTVRDRNGVTPYRFQPLFLDPYGRIVKLSVRKLF